MTIDEKFAALAARIEALERENACLRAKQEPPPPKEVEELTPMQLLEIKAWARDTHRMMKVHGSKGFDMAAKLHGRPTARELTKKRRVA